MALSKDLNYWAACHNLGYLYELRLLDEPLNFDFSEQAITYYKEAIKIDPEQSASYYRIARSFLKSKKLSDAEVYARKAIELDKNDIEYQILLAEILTSLSKYDESIQTYESLLKILPSFRFEEVSYRLATNFENVKQYQKAIDCLQSILNYENYTPFVFRRLARIYQIVQEYQTAFNYYMQYLDTEVALKDMSTKDKVDTLIDISMEHMIDPSSFDPAWIMFIWNYVPQDSHLTESDKAYLLGVICVSTGSFKSSIKYFEKALATEENEANRELIYIRFGYAYSQLGESIRAKDYFEKALKVNPNSELANKLLNIDLTSGG